MKKLNLYDMYMLGQRLLPLSNLQWEAKVADNLSVLWFARSALTEYTRDGSPLLEAAKRAARTAITNISEILPDTFEEATKIDKETKLAYVGYKIKQSVEALESVLANEMPGVPAYIVSPKGIYRTEDLIEHAEKQFPSTYLKDIPAQATADIREAGKCLAFNLPTACSFHLWRALETVMDAYYARFTSSTFDADGVSRNWGAKIKALREKKAEAAVTNYLDHIREQYRNPQTHPEEMVDPNEAQMLFGVASSAITSMISAMQQKSALTPSSSALPSLLDSAQGSS